MVKATYWISVLSVPILLVSAGCSLGPRPLATAKRGVPPERMMAMARTFERQGHYAQAKSAYLQVLAVQPDYPEARECLDTLIANEGNPDRLKKAGHPFDQRQQMIAQAKAGAEKEARELEAREQESSSKLASSESARRARKARLESAEQTRNRIAESPAAINSTADIASRETANGRDAVHYETAPRASTRSAESLLSQPLNAFVDEPVERNEALASKQVPKPPLPLPDASAPKIKAAQDAPVPTIAQSPSAIQMPIHPLESSDRDSSHSSVKESKVRLKDSPASSTPDLLTAWDSAPKSDEPGRRTETGRTSSSKADEAAIADGAELAESIQFEKPIVRPHRIEDPTLESFFGPFHAGMVQDIQSNRSEFQPKLAEIVSDQDADSEVRSRAVFLLGSIGPAAVDVVPALRREMHYDTDEYLRIDLCEAILKIQPEDEDAIRTLVDSLKETDENLRWIAAFALRSAVSPNTTFIIDSLRDSLATPDLKLRRMIFLTLAEFGPAAEKVIPELEAALESPDPATREVAKASLACIAPNRKTTSVIQKTSHRNEVTATK